MEAEDAIEVRGGRFSHVMLSQALIAMLLMAGIATIYMVMVTYRW